MVAYVEHRAALAVRFLRVGRGSAGGVGTDVALARGRHYTKFFFDSESNTKRNFSRRVFKVTFVTVRSWGFAQLVLKGEKG